MIENDEEEKCPSCQNTNYLNKSMKILYSKCNHMMYYFYNISCQNCKNRLFMESTKDTISCPLCRRELSEEDFTTNSKEEIDYISDLNSRRKICEMLLFKPTIDTINFLKTLRLRKNIMII